MKEISSSSEDTPKKPNSGSTSLNISSRNDDTSSGGDSKSVHTELRSINNDDLLKAVSKLRESKLHCGFNATKFSNVGGLD